MRLSRALRRLACEVCRLWQGSTTTEERTTLPSKECVIYGYALICHSRSVCASDDELHDVCELVVLFHNSLLYASDERHAKTIGKMKRYVDEILSRRIQIIVSYVMSHNTSSTLSALCRLVNARFPENLDWSPLKISFGGFTSSFEATNDADERHCLINLATGMILTDGNPTSSLPPRIRDVPRYVDLFGDKDFEVTHSNEVFSTTYSTNG